MDADHPEAKASSTVKQIIVIVHWYTSIVPGGCETLGDTIAILYRTGGRITAVRGRSGGAFLQVPHV